MNKTVWSGVFIIAVLIIGIIFISGEKRKIMPSNPNNVTLTEDGKQVIEITAKGGYLPRLSIAKAGVPTIIRMNTKGTFDCSSVMRIPKLNISQNLPPSGVTDIDLGIQESGTLVGTCGMGMYPFEILFEG